MSRGMPDLNCGTRLVALVGWLLAACGGDEVTTIGTGAPGTTTSVDTSAGPSTGGEPGTGDGGSASATMTATTPTTDPDTTTGVEPGGGMCKVDGDCKLRATPDQRQRCRVPSAWQMCRASGQAMRRAGLG